MISSRKRRAMVFVLAVIASSLAPVFILGAAAQPAATETASKTSETTSKQIQEKNEEVKRLEEEAKKYRDTLEDIGRQADNLQNQVKGLDRSVNRLNANIKVTNAKIGLTALEIERLKDDIAAKEDSIDKNKERLSHLIAALEANDRQTPLEIMMKNDTLSSFFSAVDGIISIQRDIRVVLGDLKTDREELTNSKTEAEKKKNELSNLADSLTDQKILQEYERRERSGLLAETKNQEKRYQELLADVERKREALQEEINALESGLQENFDRALLPRPGFGVIGWPLPDPIFITQYFGSTAFARAGAYRGKGHNGMDFRAALGTPVFAVEQGIVRATGDTDVACRRAAYGRWILIDHGNNLSTLYAHLSLIKARSGDVVNRGDLVGYSGRTGYATGPHLHLTVFAKQAVEVGQLRSRVCGRIMILPLSPFGGYLNPLDYLPK